MHEVRRSRRAFARNLTLLMLLLLAPRARCEALVDDRSLADMSLEQLSRIQVTSVARRRQPLGDAAASIYVITAEDIRRSGATSIPEALRLAPNLLVARADANQWAISARGFNSVLANKMLVLVDGRTVYSPLFSGVFWEVQDVLLEDVERIEVISGPGGTLWGTNAVDGVINIITRLPQDTQGLLIGATDGNTARSTEARWGGAIGSGIHYRVYGKLLERDASERANESSVHDGSNRSAGGFRANWIHGGQGAALQGDLYRQSIDQAGSFRRLAGGNVMGRYGVTFPDSSSLRLQAYLDRTLRDQPGSVHDALTTIDLDFLHNLPVFGRHHVQYGAGYRRQPDEVVDFSPGFALLPPTRDQQGANLYLQDEVLLPARLQATAGFKLQYDDYTRWEALPNVRLAWKPSNEHLVWAALSRAVRAPARVDVDFFSPAAPPHVFLNGGPSFRSEVLYVAELGFRGQLTPALSYSVTGFLDRDDRLRSLTLEPGGPQFENGLKGDGRGVEAWGSYRVIVPWRLSVGLLELRRHVEVAPGHTSLAAGAATLGDDPNYRWTLRSSADLPLGGEWDVMLRRVGPLSGGVTPSYTAVDSRLGVRLPGGLTASVTGQNLFAPSHAEWGPPVTRAVFDPAVLFQLEWRH